MLKVAGKYSRGGDDRPARRLGDADEAGGAAMTGEAQAHFIIFGEAVLDEGVIVFIGDEAQGGAIEGAADAGAGQGGAQGLPHDQLLAVGFGELVGIMAADPARLRVDQRHDRELDEIPALAERREDARRERVDDVLRIVEHNGGEAADFVPLRLDEGAPQDIEALRLGGGAVLRADDEAEAGIGDGADGGDGRGVVGIAADEQADVFGRPGGEGAAEHGADHLRLVPGGDEDGQRAGPERRRQIGDGERRLAALAQLQADPEQVDDKVADAEQQEPCRREQPRFPQDEKQDAGQRPHHVHAIRPRIGDTIIHFGGAKRKT